MDIMYNIKHMFIIFFTIDNLNIVFEIIKDNIAIYFKQS